MAETVASNDARQLSEALENAEKILKSGVGESNTLTLSSGVVVGLTRVSPMIFQEIDAKFPMPKIPKVFDEGRGRDLENPMHPDYLAEVERVKEAKAMAALDAVAVLGTYLISVPDGLDGPDSEGWIEKMEFLGYDQKMIDRRLTRYLSWLKSIGAPDVEEDWNRLSIAVLRKSGVTEEDVQKAIASFRDSGEEQADNEGSAAQ